MPTNNQLIAEARQLAKELGEQVSLTGKKNAELEAIVSDLKAKVKDASSDAAESVIVQKALRVAKGKAITTKRGILADGQEIKPSDLAGGQQAIDDFIKAGYIK